MTKEHFIEILRNYCNAMILDDSEPLSDWGNGSNYAFTHVLDYIEFLVDMEKDDENEKR